MDIWAVFTSSPLWIMLQWTWVCKYFKILSARAPLLVLFGFSWYFSPSGSFSSSHYPMHFYPEAWLSLFQAPFPDLLSCGSPWPLGQRLWGSGKGMRPGLSSWGLRLLFLDLDSSSCLHLNFFTSQRERMHRKLPALSIMDPSLSNT